MNGFINLSKPLHITSADAVNKVKWLLKPTKIGHAGTLDPLATGVLPLALGEGTKCINLLMDARKTYEFSVTFGERRATDDAEGEVVATSSHIPSEGEIEAILPRFTGEISQMPPIYSALKVAGRRAYDLARAGEEVVLQPRPVTIHALEFLGTTVGLAPPLPRGEVGKPSVRRSAAEADAGFPGEGGLTQLDNRPHPKNARVSSPLRCEETRHFSTSPDGRGAQAVPSEANNPLESTLRGPCVARFRAVVSKGTYIRSLGRDIAQALGSEGYISMLHRAAVGPFTDANAISLDFLEQSVHNAPPPEGMSRWLTPLERALDDIPALAIDGGQLSQLRHGQQVTLATHHPDTPQIAVMHQGQLVGLARVEGNRLISNRLLLTN